MAIPERRSRGAYSVLTLCRKGAGALRLIVGASAAVLGFEREKKKVGAPGEAD
jgi:hypothetical protein